MLRRTERPNLRAWPGLTLHRRRDAPHSTGARHDRDQTLVMSAVVQCCRAQPRMVTKFIQAKSQIKTTLLTAAAANPATSSSTQRGPPQRPGLDRGRASTVPAGVWDFLTLRDIGCPSAGSETTVCSLLHRKDNAMSILTTGLAGLKLLLAAQKSTQISPAQQRCSKLLAGFQK